MALLRYEHTGAAPETTLASGITNSALSFTVAPTGTGYPTGAVGKFVIAIDVNTANEEKVLCTARTGAVFTVDPAGRGYDGTSAVSHNTNANVEHVVAAAEIDDDNDHIYTTTRDDHTQYLRVNGSRAGTTNVQTLLGVAASGLTGAVAASRYVGATAGGAPGSGTFVAGDFIIDQLAGVWVCTVSGSPGTWTRIGPGHYVAEVYQNAAWNPVAPAIFKFDTVNFDPASMYAAGTGLFTLPLAGLWAVSAQLSVVTDATHPSNGSIQIFRNGGLGLGRAGFNYAIPVSTQTPITVESKIKCAASDTIGIQSNLSVATGETGVTGAQWTYAQVAYIGPAA